MTVIGLSNSDYYKKLVYRDWEFALRDIKLAGLSREIIWYHAR